MTSEELGGLSQSCYRPTGRARPKCLTEEKCFRLRFNRARELQHRVSVFREFQTAGAEHRKAWSARWVLVVGLCSRGAVEERRWRVWCIREVWCGSWGIQELMYVGSCESEQQACSRYVGELAASVTVPGVVEMVAVPAERFVPRCSEHVVASECCCLGHCATQRQR